ncbi:MAG TPA: hypothetical protein VFG29_04085 [Syntrophales bacterium]|nr:hypothetical protein [Syntrophales bacterium]
MLQIPATSNGTVVVNLKKTYKKQSSERGKTPVYSHQKIYRVFQPIKKRAAVISTEKELKAIPSMNVFLSSEPLPITIS